MIPQIEITRTRIGVIGAGGWGTALAKLLSDKGFQVHLWAYESEVREQIEQFRENKVFLPGFTLSPYLVASNDIKAVAADKDMLLIVVPSHVMRATTMQFASNLSANTIVVSAAKGIEIDTHLTMHGVLTETLPEVGPGRLAVISGPSFALEVARNVPTAVAVAAKDPEVAVYVQHIFATPFFRVYTNDDMIGIELGGAVKNVIAIAAGIIDGLGLGLNTRAGLITRGLAEIRRLGVKMGANPQTFAGLAGVGDLILTCTGNLSRNYSVGLKLGQGQSLAQILDDMRMVAEGVKNAKSIYHLACHLGVEMPITKEVYQILYENALPKDALYRLMTRDLKSEIEQA